MADTNPIIPITGILTPALMTGYIAESKYIKGGYVVVKDIKERDDLLNTNLYENREAIVEGSLVYVVEENKSYRFIGGSWQEDTDAFEEDAPPTMFEVGNLQKGSSVAGMSVKDILKKILYGTFYPTFTDPSIEALLSKTYQGIVGQNLEVSGTIAYDPGAIMLDGKRQNNRAGKALYYKVGEDSQKDVGDDPSNNYSFTYTFNSLKEGENKATVILHYAAGPQPLDSDGNASGSPLAEGDLTAEIVVIGEVEEKLYIGISTGSGETTFSLIESVEIKDTDAEDVTKQGLVTDSNNNVIGYQLNLPEAYSGTIEILLPREYKQLKAWNPLSSDWEVASDYFIKGGPVEHEGHTYIKYSYEVDPDDPINEPFQYRFMLN